MRVKINGVEEEVAEGADVHALLKARELPEDRVAVEINKKLVRGVKYDTVLREGDEVEIVTFVGGG